MPKRLQGLSRRDLIVASLPTLLFAGGTPAMSDRPSLEEIRRRQRDYRAEALAAFPYKIIETKGPEALTTWRKLRDGGDGMPVVVGNDEALGAIAEFYMEAQKERTVADVLAAAAGLEHPDGLYAFRRSEDAEADASVADDLSARPPIGDWPETAPWSPGLSVAMDLRTGQFFDKVKIVVVPTDDPTAIPAYLLWGGWNACPPPEYHVAALRSWRDRYKAELFGLGFDVMNIGAYRRPASREEALALAHEHYSYCEDVIVQGLETFSALGASLLENDWWYFWWD